jgi:8-oxo-dGTP pyrophosphatase MutT (NUDIX family)
MAERNEPPRRAAERELVEELGVTMAVGRMLVLDWIAPHGPWDDQLVFIFDGGTLSGEQLARLRVIDPEISEFAMLDPEEAGRRLPLDIAQRLSRAWQALSSGSIDYSESPE